MSAITAASPSDRPPPDIDQSTRSDGITSAHFKLAPRADTDSLRARFQRDGCVSIPDVLDEECVIRLHNMLRARKDWRQVINSGDRLVELDRQSRDQLAAEQVEQLDQAVYSSARYDFQYRYETIRVPDDASERSKSDDPIAAFAQWWSDGEPRELFRQITGLAEIDFADMQATAYSPGDFLTGHSDDVDGKNRLAAYVLGLTPKWRLEWGGLLVFHSENEGSARALVPGFNRVNVFRVPQLHSVSEVSRAAAYRRYSLTGWLRH